MKAQANVLGLFLTVFDVFHKLLAVTISHAWIRVSHPVVDQDLPRLTPLQHSLSESPEHVEPCSRFIPSHYFEDRAEVVPVDVAGIEHRSVSGLE